MDKKASFTCWNIAPIVLAVLIGSSFTSGCSSTQYGNALSSQYGNALSSLVRDLETLQKDLEKNKNRQQEDQKRKQRKALKLCQKSAEQGDASAQLSLGHLYMNGQGVEKDAAKAVEWYTKAAQRGLAGAQVRLGECYENGRGVAEDMEKAVEWYTKAAEQGDKAAAGKLSELARKQNPWAATPGQMAETEQWWKNLLESYCKMVLDGGGDGMTLEDFVSMCSCSNEGKSIVEAFGDEFMPNALEQYEKARDKANELLQAKEEMFPQPVRQSDATYGTYRKVVGRVVESQLNLLRTRRKLARFYLLHQAGVITNDELAKADEGNVARALAFYDEPPVLPSLRPLGGTAAEFAEKFMPDSYGIYQTFVKEHGQHLALYRQLCSDAHKTSAVYDELFQACRRKADILAQGAEYLSKSFTELYTLHKIGDVDADGLMKTDVEKAALLKPYADALPRLLRYETVNWAPEMVDIPGQSFRMGKYEVTQKEWRAVMGNNPSRFKGADLPVECVTWNDCQEFIRKLNLLTDGNYRLPTAYEWEYAWRAGSTGKYGLLADGSEGTPDEMGWHDGNCDKKKHTVGQKKPNAFGLYDMHGNVWEWTSTADGVSKVFCGGSWDDDARDCVSDHRNWINPGRRDDILGFRLVSSRATKSGE